MKRANSFIVFLLRF